LVVTAAMSSASAKMAELMNDTERQKEFARSYENARQIYHQKLWNGSYYRYDSSHSGHSDSIMTDQMAGQWYAHACELPPVVLEPAFAEAALKTVYDNNVMKFAHGRIGAGMHD
jgi:non-lysosomal glucosylceramidase